MKFDLAEIPPRAASVIYRSAVHSMRALALFCLAFSVCALFPGQCFAKYLQWDFRSSGVHTWQPVNASLESSGMFRPLNDRPSYLVSQPNLDILTKDHLFEFRLKTGRSEAGVIYFLTADGRKLQYGFQSGEPQAFNVYTIDPKDVGDSPVERVVFSFSGPEAAEFDYARFYERIGEHWRNNRREDLFQNTTINSIDAPSFWGMSITKVLYAIVLMSAIGLVAVLRPLGVRSAVRALMTSFLLAGAILGLWMDLDWLKVWSKDSAQLAGKGLDQRIVYLFGGNADYLPLELKKIISPDRAVKVYTRNRGLMSLFKYHLLPITVSDKNYGYVLVVEDELAFDPERAVLERSGQVVERGVSLVKKGEDFALYERKAL